MKRKSILKLTQLVLVSCIFLSIESCSKTDTKLSSTDNIVNENVVTSSNNEDSHKDTTKNTVENSDTETLKEKYTAKLSDIQSSLSDLESYYSGPPVEMRYAAEEEYKRWDSVLNEIYSELKKSLSASDMDKLEKEEVQWIKDKEEKALNDSLEYKNSTNEHLSYLTSLAQSTKDRCYELVNNYM